MAAARWLPAAACSSMLAVTLRIVHIDRQRGWTGQTNRTLNMVVGLRRRGFECDLVTHPDSGLARHARERGVEPVEMPLYGSGTYTSVPRLWRLLRKRRVDLLHCHGPRDHLLAAIVRLLGGCPHLIRTRHNHVPLSSGLFSRLLFVPCDRVVCISDYVRRLSLDDRLPEQKLTTIRTAVDTERWSPAEGSSPDDPLRDELGLRPGDLVVGHVSTLVKRKGVDWLLEAAARLVTRRPDLPLRLLIVGEAYRKWQALAERLGVSDRVVFTGFRTDAERLIRLMDLFVLPSREEGLGTAVVEAMSCGTAVIGSNVGGIPEAVTPDVGLLFEPSDVDGLTERIETLLDDAPRRGAMARAARQRAVNEFSVEAMVDRMAQLYRGLAAP